MKLKVLAIAALLLVVDSVVTRFSGSSQTQQDTQMVEPSFYK